MTYHPLQAEFDLVNQRLATATADQAFVLGLVSATCWSRGLAVPAPLVEFLPAAWDIPTACRLWRDWFLLHGGPR